MTRSTRIAVTSPGVEPFDLWRAMATAIVAPEQYRFEVTDTGIYAALGQGLCALLGLDHAADRSLIPAEVCDEWCSDPCTGWLHDPGHYLMADFDTAYSYTGPCGCHSGGLHMQLVTKVGGWLDRRGATWEWFDESGDCWNHGPDWGSLNHHLDEVCAEHRRLVAPTNVRKAA